MSDLAAILVISMLVMFVIFLCFLVPYATHASGKAYLEGLNFAQKMEDGLPEIGELVVVWDDEGNMFTARLVEWRGKPKHFRCNRTDATIPDVAYWRYMANPVKKKS